jgi:hypothetical protein
VIRWQSASNRWYTVQASTNLVDGFNLILGGLSVSAHEGGPALHRAGSDNGPESFAGFPAFDSKHVLHGGEERVAVCLCFGIGQAGQKLDVDVEVRAPNDNFIANFAVAPSWLPPPDPSDFPARMLIDWIWYKPLPAPAQGN